MMLDELDAAWTAVQVPESATGLGGKRVPDLPATRPIYLALDGQKKRHLLIRVPDDTKPVDLKETRSLEVSTARYTVATQKEALYVDLLCVDTSQHPTFCAVAQDLIHSIKTSPLSLRDGIISCLSRWRSFWSTRLGTISQEDAIGLFGELWFMRRWLGPVNVDILKSWQATPSARHDFQSRTCSIEVKTAVTRIAGLPTHHVTSLEQLSDPEHGQLFLYSLQLCDDALTTNTLHSLVQGLTAELQTDFQSLTILNEKLAERGYSPSDQHAPARTLRVLGEHLYRINHDFPRLVRDTFQPPGIPTGIVDIQYSIDLSACQQWLVATSPNDAAAQEIRL